jgi:hypothetical protein
MKYAVELGSGAMLFIPSFIKISSAMLTMCFHITIIFMALQPFVGPWPIF